MAMLTSRTPGTIRTWLLVALLATGAVVALAHASTDAVAAQVDTTGPVIDQPAPALPGDIVTLTGSGWEPGNECALIWNGPASDPGPSCVVSDSGALAGELPVPAEATAATYTVTACQPLCDPVDGFATTASTELVVQSGEPSIVVPDLQGLTLEQAQQEVEETKLALRPSGSGVVVDQTPSAGEAASPGDIVTVQLSTTETSPTLSTPTDGAGSTTSDSAEDPLDRASVATVLAVLALVLLVLVAAVAGWSVLRHRQKAPVPARVEAVVRSLRPPIVTVRGSDTPPRWTIGLTPRADPGRVTLEEPDR